MKLGVLQPDQDGEMVMNKAFEEMFNSMWADNGDAISKQYAGTAALKVVCLLFKLLFTILKLAIKIRLLKKYSYSI